MGKFYIVLLVYFGKEVRWVSPDVEPEFVKYQPFMGAIHAVSQGWSGSLPLTSPQLHHLPHYWPRAHPK